MGSEVTVPDLVVGLAPDPEHLLPLQLQLPGQRTDGLVEGVDLVVQVCDAIGPTAHFLL